MQLMKATVSAFAVAVALLAAGTTAIAQDQGDQQSKPASIAQAAPTAADAEAFVKQAEKELFDFSILNSRAQWVNSTYITDDTDTLAAHFGTIGPAMPVRFANEAEKYQKVPGLRYDTKRKLDILRSGLILPAPTTPAAPHAPNKIANTHT